MEKLLPYIRLRYPQLHGQKWCLMALGPMLLEELVNTAEHESPSSGLRIELELVFLTEGEASALPEFEGW